VTLKRIFILSMAIIFAIFVFQNAQVVEVRFLFWSAQASRALVLIGTLILGLVIGWLSSWLRQQDHEQRGNNNA
jgi:putative membrane protein